MSGARRTSRPTGGQQQSQSQSQSQQRQQTATPQRNVADFGPPAIIAVMGATGSGKSSFINLLVPESQLEVGNGLQSCTKSVEVSPVFELADRLVTLVDTPGFDDTELSDTQILSMIALFLTNMYEEEKLLTGVVYLHRISDVRVGGTSRRNFDMFQKLCGQDAMKNVVIATNMWELVNDSNVAEARHQELITQDIFFKPAIEAGANILQHHNTKQSGEAIIRALLSCQPVPLQIQREIVDERRDITETAAGAALLRELTEMAERHKYEIDQIQVEMREALRNKDQETRMELDRARNELLEKQRRAEEERRLLVSNFTDEREALEREMGIIRRMLEEEAEARRLQERMVTQSHRSQQQRTNLMQQTNQRLHQQLAELQRRHNGGNLAGFSIMNLILPAMTALVAIMV